MNDVNIDWRIVRSGILLAAKGFLEARDRMPGAATIANGLRLIGDAIVLVSEEETAKEHARINREIARLERERDAANGYRE